MIAQLISFSVFFFLVFDTISNRFGGLLVWRTVCVLLLFVWSKRETVKLLSFIQSALEFLVRNTNCVRSSKTSQRSSISVFCLFFFVKEKLQRERFTLNRNAIAMNLICCEESQIVLWNRSSPGNWKLAHVWQWVTDKPREERPEGTTRENQNLMAMDGECGTNSSWSRKQIPLWIRRWHISNWI